MKSPKYERGDIVFLYENNHYVKQVVRGVAKKKWWYRQPHYLISNWDLSDFISIAAESKLTTSLDVEREKQ